MNEKTKKLVTKILYVVLLVIASQYLLLLQNDDEAPSQSAESTIEVHFIYVGQAESILIKHPEGNMLIDAGEGSDYTTVDNYLKAQDVSSFEYIISTHPHSDHIGGLADVINNYDVKNVMAPKVVHSSKVFENFITAVSDKNLSIITPISGENFSIADMKFTILAPNSETYENLNNYSIVLKMEYGQTSFLFTGDAETFSEKEILSKGYDISADVLNIGHHGSKTSTSENFLEAVSPQYGIISCGINNSYNHPDEKPIELLNKYNVEIFRTDLQGNIVTTSDGVNIEVKGENDGR